MSTEMTKTDRRDLGRLVRQQFKVLRADVAAREAELVAELGRRIADRFAAEDREWAQVQATITGLVRDTNLAIGAVLQAHYPDRYPPGSATSEYTTIRHYPDRPNQSRRNIMFSNGQARITAQVTKALLTVDRQEADLLAQLITGGLESDAARAFVEKIPTADALVPAERLLELEPATTAPVVTAG